MNDEGAVAEKDEKKVIVPQERAPEAVQKERHDAENQRMSDDSSIEYFTYGGDDVTAPEPNRKIDTSTQVH